MTWLEALLTRKARLEHELALVEELEEMAGDMDWEEKDEEAEARDPEANPSPAQEPSRPPEVAPEAPPLPKRGRSSPAVEEILTEALRVGKPALHAKEIAAELERAYGIHWGDASANMGTVLRAKGSRVERAGRGMYRLKAQAEPDPNQTLRVGQVEQIMLNSGMQEMDPEMIFEDLHKLDPKAHWEDPDLSMRALCNQKGGDIFLRTPRGTWRLKPDPLRRRSARMLGGGGTLTDLREEDGDDAEDDD